MESKIGDLEYIIVGIIKKVVKDGLKGFLKRVLQSFVHVKKN